MAVAQTTSDKLEKTRQSAASLEASYDYQYVIGGIVGLFIIRNIIITIRKHLNRRNQSLAQKKLLSSEKGSRSQSTQIKASHSVLSRSFDKVERLGVKKIDLNFYPFSGEKGMNWVQLIVLSLIMGFNIAFSLSTTTSLITPSTVNSNVARAFARRTGRMAVANFPLLYAVAGRNNLVSLLTGIKYQEVRFVHKALGRVVALEVFVHTFAYVGYYLNGPGVAKLYGEYTEDYFQWGIAATVGALVLVVFSLRWMRGKYYELFLISHILGAIMMLSGAYYHQKIIINWVWAGAAFWVLERFIRIVRHVSSIFNTRLILRRPILTAHAKVISGAVLLRVPFPHSNWKAGQHCCISFWGLGLLKKPWLYGQSHPFSISNMPDISSAEIVGQELRFVLRIKDGLTKTLANHVSQVIKSIGSEEAEVKISLEGPYGDDEASAPISDAETVVLIAGGSGITHVASILADIANKINQSTAGTTSLQLVWAIHHLEQAKWIGTTFSEVQKAVSGSNVQLKLDLYLTRAALASPSDSSDNVSTDAEEKEKSGASTPIRGADGVIIHHGRPDIANLVRLAIADCPRKMVVVACGPAELAQVTRAATQGYSLEELEVIIPLYEA